MKAFQYAREANPNALLLLNDTFGQGGIDKERVDEFFSLGRSREEKGCPDRCHRHRDALGTAGSCVRTIWTSSRTCSIGRAKLGVKVHITEMDVYQGPDDTPEAFAKQKEVFYNIVHACLKDSNCIGFMTWGIADRYTWLRTSDWKNFPNAKPVLFDDDYKKKPAYDGVLQALKEGTMSSGIGRASKSSADWMFRNRRSMGLLGGVPSWAASYRFRSRSDLAGSSSYGRPDSSLECILRCDSGDCADPGGVS